MSIYGTKMRCECDKSKIIPHRMEIGLEKSIMLTILIQLYESAERYNSLN